MKLYRSNKDTVWFAFDSTGGWVTFPAEVGGWRKRKPFTGETVDLFEVHLRMGFNTGIPGALMSKALFLVPKSKHQKRQFPLSDLPGLLLTKRTS